MEEMTVPLDTVNDIRSMDAAGRSRSEIARMLHVSRNTVAKYADMEDMSPAAPMPRRRGRPALEGNEEWVAGVLEADLGAPRKQRHTARRIYDRLVAERGYGGSYSTVQRFVRELRLARAAAGGEGYLELEWAPGTCQVDFGNFRAAVGGRTLDLKLLVATLPHSNDRQCVALMSQRSECLCSGLLEIFRRWGRAPAAMVLDNATEAGRMVRGEVTESRLFSQFRAHYRFESRYCNPYSGNEKGSVENAVGFLRRNLLVPVPAFGALPELNAFLAEGCARVNAAARCRDGRPHGEAYREDLAAMRSLPGVEFDAVRWVTARADKRGYVEADGREYVAGPAWHGRSLLVGMRASTVEILADRGRRVAVLPRAFGEGPAVRNPLSLVPAIIARPRAFGESTIRRDMPPGLVEGIDRMDSAGRRRTLRSIGRASESSGFEAACEAALRVVEGGRSCSLTTAVLEEWSRLGTPKQVEYLAGYLEAERSSREASKRATLLRRCALPAPKTFDGYDWSAVSWPEGMGRESLLALDFVERREDLVLMGDVGTGKTHMASALCALACERRLEARFFTASSLVMRLRRARDDGRLDREAALIGKARLLVIDELGFLPLDADGARLLFQVFADAYERQSVVITTNLEFSRWGSVFGDDQMAAAVIDRIVHHGRLVQFRGESYRVRHALMQEG